MFSWRRIGVVCCSISILFSVSLVSAAAAQMPERIFYTATNAEDINQAVFRYGIERGFFRDEGIELVYRFLPPNLALSALMAKDIDYLSQLGTLVYGAVRGLPVKVVAIGYDKPFFFIMTQPNIKSAKELIGKKFAVSSLRGTAARTARSALKALGLNPDKDLTLIVVGQSSMRLLAMEAKSVEATVVPSPWNFRFRDKGFNELVFAGKYVSEPFVGIATSDEKLQTKPNQVKRFLRGFLRSLKAIKTVPKEATAFIARTYKLEPAVAAEIYETTSESLTQDGTVDAEMLQDYLQGIRNETKVNKEVKLSDVFDFRLLREAAKEIEK
jgi:ABC-type nitrate/sulfonate/bicarbonate transport system substrate-binding protein